MVKTTMEQLLQQNGIKARATKYAAYPAVLIRDKKQSEKAAEILQDAGYRIRLRYHGIFPVYFATQEPTP